MSVSIDESWSSRANVWTGGVRIWVCRSWITPVVFDGVWQPSRAAELARDSKDSFAGSESDISSAYSRESAPSPVLLPCRALASTANSSHCASKSNSRTRSTAMFSAMRLCSALSVPAFRSKCGTGDGW